MEKQKLTPEQLAMTCLGLVGFIVWIPFRLIEKIKSLFSAPNRKGHP